MVIKSDPSRSRDKTRITAMVYWGNREVRGLINGTRSVITGWQYQLSCHQDPNAWYKESTLRKLPPEDRTGWEDCVFNPHKEKAPSGA